MINELERCDNSRSLIIFGHGYQPGRAMLLPDNTTLAVVPDMNGTIHGQCYERVLASEEPLPEGFAFSLYTPLRAWMKQFREADFARIKEKISQMPDKEYSVLGDPFVHVILPLLPEKDQDMLLQIGRRAFSADFGFEPEGLWLPETGVASRTLELACRSGYKFVVLRDNQLENSQQNPMFVRLAEDSETAVFHFDSKLSEAVSFNEWATVNADNFLDYWIPADQQGCAIGTDMEVYGHHWEQRDKWLKHLLKPETLARHGFVPLSLRAALSTGNRVYTNVKEFSSWSCEHDLGRWTGECGCDGTIAKTQWIKKGHFRSLFKYNGMVNQRLDELDSNWIEEFGDLAVDLRDKIFTGGDFLIELKKAVSREKYYPYLEKFYIILGFTSCGWFPGKSDSPERAIPETMVRITKQLLKQTPLPELVSV